MPEHAIRSVLDLSLDEQIGQLLMVGFTGTEPTAEIVELIQRRAIGGIILFSRNVHDIQQSAVLTRSLQQLAKDAGQRYPLLIAIDQENGMVQRLGSGATTFPGNMALGAIGSTETAFAVAQATGEELQALGVNLNLAPVVDVNNNPANPVIGVRSFGENPQQVARFAEAIIRGYHSANTMTCLKHFPGHGDTAVDSHLALPSISHTPERLEQVELVPFQSGIAAGTDMVMIAHIVFSGLSATETLPATVSPAIVQGLLREKLGFGGVVISDCLEMDAIARTLGIGPASVMALQAGCDLILISHRYERQLEGLEAIRTAVQAGKISPYNIRRSVERVLYLKRRYLSWDSALAPLATSDISSVSTSAHRSLRDDAYEHSTTLVKDEQGLLPIRLQKDQRLLVLYPQRKQWTQVEDRGYPHEVLLDELRRRHPFLTALSITSDMTTATYEAIDHAAAEADLVLIITVNAYTDQQQIALVQHLLAKQRPIIGLAVYNPYDLLAFPALGTYLVTYEFTVPAIAAAVRVLFGELVAQGKLPVKL